MKTAGLVKAGAFKAWQKVTNAERDDWLLQAGFDGSSDEAEWNAFRDEVHKEVPFRLWNAHITLYSSHLLWGLEVPGSVVQIAPILVQAWLEGTAGEGSDEFLATHRAALQALCRDRELILFPIWSANGGAGQEHWTLLAVDRKAKAVRYYDTLLEEAAGNRGNADQVWSM
jgi:hypothetical protein